MAMVLPFATSQSYGWIPLKYAGSFWTVLDTPVIQRAAVNHLFQLQDGVKSPKAGQTTNQ